ncbi:MAG: G5 domain-containing protein [Armatimonadota bacterium]
MSFDERTNRILARLRGQVRFYRATSAILLLLVLVLALLLVLGSRQRFARAIRIDGEKVCLVSDQRAAQRVHEILLERGSGDLPGEAALQEQWQDEPWPVDENEVLSVEEAVKLLQPRVTVLVDAYTIEVDGAPTVTLPSEELAKDVLDALKSKYLGEGEKLAEPQSFLQEVKIAPQRAKADSVVTEIGLAVEQLAETHREAQTYTVKPGDFPEKIAAKHGMTPAELYDLNPGLKGSVIHPGDTLKVAPAVQGITVKTVKEVTRSEEVEPGVKKTHTVNMPKGETMVSDAGSPGKKLIIEHLTYHNDRHVETEVKSTKIVEQPSPKRILVGTGESSAGSGEQG